MVEKVVEISLPLLLPEIQESCDPCIDRLQTSLQGQKGILFTHLHLDHIPVDLCIHFDPNLISLGAVERIAAEAGTEFRNRYSHKQIPFSGLDSADSANLITKELENMNGMLHASVNYAAGLAIVAYDSKVLSLEQIYQRLRLYGARPVIESELREEGATGKLSMTMVLLQLSYQHGCKSAGQFS